MADVAPDLRGRDVVHIQCHIGFDTIALARRGARVTGVDFSRASLAKAAELAERCGVEIEWVQANTTALPDSLRGGFEVAYATIGAICWIEDIGAWMRSAAATLRPGGRLVLVEIHPLYAMVEAAAATLHALLLPFADRYAQAPVEASFGCVARGLGVLASVLGRHDEAVAHLEAAIEIERRMRARPWIAHAQHGLGEALLARGGPGDADRAQALLDEVGRRLPGAGHGGVGGASGRGALSPLGVLGRRSVGESYDANHATTPGLGIGPGSS
jgi:SAM-dependent methyltransferase